MKKKSGKVFKVLVIGEITKFAGEVSLSIHQFLEEKEGLSFKIESEFRLSRAFTVLVEEKKSFDFVLLDIALKGATEFQSMFVPSGHSFGLVFFNSETRQFEFSETFDLIEKILNWQQSTRRAYVK